jgi:hypothetical protein
LKVVVGTPAKAPAKEAALIHQLEIAAKQKLE